MPPKLMAKDGKIQQYAALAKHIFASEPGQSSLYLQNPRRYGTAVETRLRQYIHSFMYIPLTLSSSLKSEYMSHLKTLGSRGAGLDPSMISRGSPIANLIS